MSHFKAPRAAWRLQKVNLGASARRMIQEKTNFSAEAPESPAPPGAAHPDPQIESRQPIRAADEPSAATPSREMGADARPPLPPGGTAFGPGLPPSLRESPVSATARIGSLDVLRGFAVLGILVMNIQSFAMVGSAYMNPTSWGDMSGANGIIWHASHVLADSKFMALFSILFGAGIVLVSQRRQSAGKSPAALHYRRMLGLLGIGLIHAYLFWYGDILVPYAICGSIVFVVWSVRARWLVLGSISLLIIGVLSILLIGFSLEFMPEKDHQEMQDTVWAPTPAEIDKELATYRGPWLPQLAHRAETTIMIQTAGLFMLSWRITGLMLLGMALLKTGFLSGRSTNRTYFSVLIVGSLIGFPLVSWGITRNAAANWSMNFSMFSGTLPNYFASILIALAYVAGIQLLLRSAIRRVLVDWLAPVGRMALTNYLSQTLLCTLIFYGHGLALFGSVNRRQQLIIVVAIWIVQILFSKFWMARFRFGPCEYAWRAMTYLKLPSNPAPVTSNHLAS